MVPFTFTPDFIKDFADIVEGGEVTWFDVRGRARGLTDLAVDPTEGILRMTGTPTTSAQTDGLGFLTDIFKLCLFREERYYFAYGHDSHIFCVTPKHLPAPEGVPACVRAALAPLLGWPLC